MTSHRVGARLFAAALLLIFLLQETASCAAPLSDRVLSHQPSIAEIVSDPSKLAVPYEFCVLKEFHAGPSGKLIIHIQDAHSNPGAQRNLARMLSRFAASGTRLVLVEGASRDVSLTPLRKLASRSVWKRAAGRFLMEGKIAGEEYLNLTSDDAIRLEGIEAPGLYWETLRRYSKLAEKRADVLSFLKRVRKAADRIKGRIYPRELLRYEQMRSETEESSYKELLRLSAEKGIETAAYPRLAPLMQTALLEASIDFSSAQMEQFKLVEAVSRLGSDVTPEQFVKSGEGILQTTAGRLGFLQRLFAEASRFGIDLSDYPELGRYADYLRAAGRIDYAAIADDLGLLEEELYRRLLTTEKAKTLRAVDRYVGWMESAFGIRISSPDYALLRRNEPYFKSDSLLAFLNGCLLDMGAGEDLIAQTADVAAARPALQNFYRLVSRRDSMFVRNAERLMLRDQANAAVLIAGGYHTAHLTQLLKARGFSYAVLAPLVTETSDQGRYEDVLLSSLSAASASHMRAPALAEPVPGAAYGSRLLALTDAARLLDPRLARQSAAQILRRTLLRSIPRGARTKAPSSVELARARDYARAKSLLSRIQRFGPDELHIKSIVLKRAEKLLTKPEYRKFNDPEQLLAEIVKERDANLRDAALEFMNFEVEDVGVLDRLSKKILEARSTAKYRPLAMFLRSLRTDNESVFESVRSDLGIVKSPGYFQRMAKELLYKTPDNVSQYDRMAGLVTNSPRFVRDALMHITEREAKRLRWKNAQVAVSGEAMGEPDLVYEEAAARALFMDGSLRQRSRAVLQDPENHYQSMPGEARPISIALLVKDIAHLTSKTRSEDEQVELDVKANRLDLYERAHKNLAEAVNQAVAERPDLEEGLRSLVVAALFMDAHLLIPLVLAPEYRWGMMRNPRTRKRPMAFVPIEAMADIVSQKDSNGVERSVEMRLAVFSLIYAVEWHRYYASLRGLSASVIHRRMKKFEQAWNRAEKPYLTTAFLVKHCLIYMNDHMTRFTERRWLNQDFAHIKKTAVKLEHELAPIIAEAVGPDGYIDWRRISTSHESKREEILPLLRQLETITHRAMALGDYKMALAMARWSHRFLAELRVVESGMLSTHSYILYIRLLVRLGYYSEFLETLRDLKNREIRLGEHRIRLGEEDVKYFIVEANGEDLLNWVDTTLLRQMIIVDNKANRRKAAETRAEGVALLKEILGPDTRLKSEALQPASSGARISAADILRKLEESRSGAGGYEPYKVISLVDHYVPYDQDERTVISEKILSVMAAMTPSLHKAAGDHIAAALTKRALSAQETAASLQPKDVRNAYHEGIAVFSAAYLGAKKSWKSSQSMTALRVMIHAIERPRELEFHAPAMKYKIVRVSRELGLDPFAAWLAIHRLSINKALYDSIMLDPAGASGFMRFPTLRRVFVFANILRTPAVLERIGRPDLSVSSIPWDLAQIKNGEMKKALSELNLVLTSLDQKNISELSRLFGVNRDNDSLWLKMDLRNTAAENLVRLMQAKGLDTTVFEELFADVKINRNKLGVSSVDIDEAVNGLAAQGAGNHEGLYKELFTHVDHPEFSRANWIARAVENAKAGDASFDWKGFIDLLGVLKAPYFMHNLDLREEDFVGIPASLAEAESTGKEAALRASLPLLDKLGSDVRFMKYFNTMPQGYLVLADESAAVFRYNLRLMRQRVSHAGKPFMAVGSVELSLKVSPSNNFVTIVESGFHSATPEIVLRFAAELSKDTYEIAGAPSEPDMRRAWLVDKLMDKTRLEEAKAILIAAERFEKKKQTKDSTPDAEVIKTLFPGLPKQPEWLLTGEARAVFAYNLRYLSERILPTDQMKALRTSSKTKITLTSQDLGRMVHNVEINRLESLQKGRLSAAVTLIHSVIASLVESGASFDDLRSPATFDSVLKLFFSTKSLEELRALTARVQKVTDAADPLPPEAPYSALVTYLTQSRRQGAALELGAASTENFRMKLKEAIIGEFTVREIAADMNITTFSLNSVLHHKDSILLTWVHQAIDRLAARRQITFEQMLEELIPITMPPTIPDKPALPEVVADAEQDPPAALDALGARLIVQRSPAANWYPVALGARSAIYARPGRERKNRVDFAGANGRIVSRIITEASIRQARITARKELADPAPVNMSFDETRSTNDLKRLIANESALLKRNDQAVLLTFDAETFTTRSGHITKSLLDYMRLISALNRRWEKIGANARIELSVTNSNLKKRLGQSKGMRELWKELQPSPSRLKTPAMRIHLKERGLLDSQTFDTLHSQGSAVLSLKGLAGEREDSLPYIDLPKMTFDLILSVRAVADAKLVDTRLRKWLKDATPLEIFKLLTGKAGLDLVLRLELPWVRRIGLDKLLHQAQTAANELNFSK